MALVFLLVLFLANDVVLMNADLLRDPEVAVG